MFISPSRLLFLTLICFGCMTANATTQTEVPNIRVGVLKYGTVNWEIEVIKRYQLDKKYNFTLQVMPLSNKNASAVALQSKAVDIILSDWLWVNRQRYNDKGYTLVPTSIASGGLYISSDSTATSLADLKQVKIGVAGGSVDKNWLLLQAYAQKKYQLNIKDNAEIVFATPPLLNRLMQRKAVDAAINFWHYNARLAAKGNKLLVSMPQMLTELGISKTVPVLGWVFDQTWAIENNPALTSFLKASEEAKQLLFLCDEEWQRIRPLTKAEDDKVFSVLKNEYRARILHTLGSEELNASKQIFTILAEQGGRNLVGKAKALAEGTFWQTNKLNPSAVKSITKTASTQQLTCPLK